MPLIIIYLFLEVIVSTYFASIFGGLLTFILIILSAFIGITLLRTFKYSLSSNIKNLTEGNITQEDFIKTNLSKALGAILLIVPGFLTDIIGLLFQFGILTMLFSKIFKTKPSSMYTKDTTGTNNFYYSNQKSNDIDDEIIDVEIIEDTNKIDK